MSELRVPARFTIHDGRLDELEKIAALEACGAPWGGPRRARQSAARDGGP